jgi:hypothetical protein
VHVRQATIFAGQTVKFYRSVTDDQHLFWGLLPQENCCNNINLLVISTTKKLASRRRSLAKGAYFLVWSSMPSLICYLYCSRNISDKQSTRDGSSMIWSGGGVLCQLRCRVVSVMCAARPSTCFTTAKSCLTSHHVITQITVSHFVSNSFLLYHEK